MPASQIIGTTTLTVAEVEANHALRGTLRPRDYTTMGEYCVGGVSGVMAAGILGHKTIFAFRFPGPTSFALIRRIRFTAAGDTVAFTAGPLGFVLIPVRSFITSASGGTALTPSGNMNKMRTSMATTSVADVRIATTAALTDGTQLPDQNPTLSVGTGLTYDNVGGVGTASAGKNLFTPDAVKSSLLDHKPGEYPLVLAANEGFIIRTGVSFAATGTWRFGVDVVWGEGTRWY